MPAHIVILPRLELLHENIGHGQHHWGAVYQHGHPAFQQAGGHHIGFFCPSHRFEGRAGAVPDEFLHIVGVQHAVDLYFTQTAAQPLQNPGLHHPFHIADAKSGFGFLAHLGKFEFQMGRADLPANHGDIHQNAFGEALPRPPQHLF